jgi:hypothetical protein
MEEPADLVSQAAAREASSIHSVFNINVTAYSYSMMIRDTRRDASDAVVTATDTSKPKARSDSLVTDTQARQLAEGLGETATTKPTTQPSSAQNHAQATSGPSCYFRCPFFSFNPDTVDLNKIGIVYEYRQSYFIMVDLPHPSTRKNIHQSGFIGRSVVGPYLAAEWASLTKEEIGESGTAVCANDGRWAAHSHMLQSLRYRCRREALIMQHSLAKLGEEQVKLKLSQVFKLVVNWVHTLEERKAHEQNQVADKFMEEFMVFED